MSNWQSVVTTLSLFLMAILLLAASPSWSAMPAAPHGVEGMKAEGGRKVQDGAKPPVRIAPARRATEFVRKIEGGVLYTESGRYSLQGVKVMDLTNDGSVSSLGKKPKKTAEMIFLGDQLREVVIRQRQ